MRRISTYNGQTKPIDTVYPDGDIKDDTGSNNGTDIDEKSNADMQQFHAKIMRSSDTNYNALPDNEYNGQQLYTASRKVFNRVGVCIPFDRSFSALASGKYGTLFIIPAGAPNSGDIALPDSLLASTFDLISVIVINRSSNPCDLFPSGTDTVELTSSYIVTAGSRVEFILNKAAKDWVLVSGS